ncbi:E3 ubiquitin ligase [Allonocardiopsis opalescens]|uniref:RING-type E3 ubiquitin transferase n=1 Tax=Allonocardiopsis opalescens TaxID=1144618 RepID=A0A2T0Q3X4_9ACTN|nr:E3 ubiquitin ligase [Allonocardiopsis opalescens]
MLVLAIALARWYAAWSRYDAVRRTPTLSVAEIRRRLESAGSVVAEVVGQVGADPGRELTAPFSGRSAVWWHTCVVRHYWHYDSNHDRDHGPTRTRRTSVAAEKASQAPLLVTDGTGTVRVLLEGARMVIDGLSHDDFEEGTARADALGIVTPPGSGHIGYGFQERLIRAGEQVCVLGEITRENGELLVRAPEAEHFLVSNTSSQRLEDELRGAHWQAAAIVVLVLVFAAITVLVVMNAPLTPA